MVKREVYLDQILEWEYCYCRDCDRIRYGSELEATERGIKCSKCGGYDFGSSLVGSLPSRESGGY